METTWEYTCGNCDETFEVDSVGDRIQTCPECDSQEMIKGLS
jgi:DNA-directed RNA polymerase subunit RPC12/RpoP